jgi:hypothetical protein
MRGTQWSESSAPLSRYDLLFDVPICELDAADLAPLDQRSFR